MLWFRLRRDKRWKDELLELHSPRHKRKKHIKSLWKLLSYLLAIPLCRSLLKFLQSTCISSETPEDFMYQADNREISSARKEHMPYPRFTKVIINHFISKDNTISMRNRINLHTVRNDTMLDIKDSKAYKTYLDYATRKVPSKKARKFKKPTSPKLKTVPASLKEPTQKGKRVKRASKKATTASTTDVVIRDTPIKSVSKKKAPAKTDRGKGIELLSDAALLEDAQLKKTLARKFKKPTSPKLKTVPASLKEPTQKGKRVKRASKKATTASTTDVVIRDTPIKSVSKKKAPAKTNRGKGIELLSDAALLEDAQLKKTLRKSKQEAHKLQASGSSEGADFKLKVPDEQTDKTKDTSEGTYVKLGVPDMSKEDSSDSDEDSWGNNENESDDFHDEDDNDDDDGNDDDSGNDDDGGNDTQDSKWTNSDDDENHSFTLKDYKEEEQDEEYVHTPEKDKSNDDEKMYEEEDVDVFDQMVSALETKVSEFNQTSQFVEAVSSILGIVDNYLASKLKEEMNKPEKPQTPDHAWNNSKSVDFRSPQKWISTLSKARKPPRTFNELIGTTIDFSAYVMNRLKIENLTQEILVGRGFNLLKGTCKSFAELEYHFEECYKAVNDKLDWNNPKGHTYPFDLSKPLTLIEDRGHQVVPVDYFINNDLEYLKGGSLNRKYTTSTTRTKATKIIAVTSVKVIRWYDYGYLEEIVVRRDDNVLYKFKEGDFSRLNLRIVILHRVEDLQMGVENYQKKLNITRPETFRSDILNMIPYTAYKNPQGIIYQDKFKRKRLMRSDELYKFFDGTLSSVKMVLHDIASSLEMDYLPKRH
nr:hypothetical protein [Tanacetum cinerariifolium]